MSLRTWICIALAMSPSAGVLLDVAARFLHAHALQRRSRAQHRCPPPPRAPPGSEPFAEHRASNTVAIPPGPAELRPLAVFSLNARVLSREDYASAAMPRCRRPTSPWAGTHARGPVLSRLDISQSGRCTNTLAGERPLRRWKSCPAPVPTCMTTSRTTSAAAALSRCAKAPRCGSRAGWWKRRPPTAWSLAQFFVARGQWGRRRELVFYVCSLRVSRPLQPVRATVLHMQTL